MSDRLASLLYVLARWCFEIGILLSDRDFERGSFLWYDRGRRLMRVADRLPYSKERQ